MPQVWAIAHSRTSLRPRMGTMPMPIWQLR